MDKQELIDKLVDELKGIWPAHWVTAVYDVKSGLFSSWPPRRKADLLENVCTPEEFELRAKELGWISGYKCGVEYPTNGKIPALPDDTVVYYETKSGHSATTSMGGLDFAIGQSNEIKSFRIVGERTKDLSDVIFAVSDAISVAVDAGAMSAAMELQKINWDLLAKNHGVGIGQRELQANPDNSWHERGVFPPSGTYCQFQLTDGTSNWVNCFIIGTDDLGFCVCRADMDYLASMSASSFRPIKTRREKFIEAALDVVEKSGNDCDAKYITALYEAGFKAPDEKNRS